MGLIEHVENPRRFLQPAHSLLQPSGRLYLQTPDAGSLPTHFLGCTWPPLTPIEHIRVFSRRSLKRLLGQCGFETLRVCRHVKWLPVGYVYEMRTNFGGSCWQRLFRPIRTVLGDYPLPFYVGEILVEAAPIAG